MTDASDVPRMPCVACGLVITLAEFEHGCSVTLRAHVRAGDSTLAKLYTATDMSARFAASLPSNRLARIRKRKNKKRTGPSHE